MGTQWSGMGKDMMTIEIFHKSIKQSAEILKPFEVELMSLILKSSPDDFSNVLNSFVTIVAIQVALIDVLRWIGIQPDGMIGHSIGELACAYADDTLSHEQTILVAYYRGT